MIISEQKPFEEILGYLNGENSVFILGCNGCAQSSGTGGPLEVEEMRKKLEEAGKKVAGAMVIDFLCEKALVKSRLRARTEQVKAADSMLAFYLTDKFECLSAIHIRHHNVETYQVVRLFCVHSLPKCFDGFVSIDGNITLGTTGQIRLQQLSGHETIFDN